MRKKTIIVCVLAIAFTVYAIYARNSIRGLNIYLLSYQVGKWFIRTYLPAAVLAAAAWIISIVWLRKDMRIRKEKKQQYQQPDNEKKQQYQQPDNEEKTEYRQPDNEIKMQSPAAAYCKACGAKMQPEHKFCAKCGARAE